MTSMKDLIKELNETMNDNIYALNDGGCGVFAYYMAKKLEELHIPYKIVCECYSTYSKDISRQNKTYLEKRTSEVDKRFLAPSHFLIYLPEHGLLFDGYRCREYSATKLTMDRLLGTYSKYPAGLDFLKYSVLHGKNWNDLYHRSQNPTVKAIIARIFKK